ncbi:uncharacterized protein DUF3540 [Roseibium hamelinense]|uniref:Uncharacterized protein DUF3540 n=1 Tax=Roseibium hamelinense TaxID=150831 RepID=A0A562SE67_9HYPH|nr:DUF3540 domain-containing protein [Roseibium hamelinense]MTI42562.1 DUF3540 domain-containing protein [Roseibium hamelinense]TWI79559.1 uncharacterized protein DUF3540 [Roseibium hamelinense]
MLKQDKSVPEAQGATGRRIRQQDMTMCTAHVTALVTETQALVGLPGGESIHADQAAGCLLAPAIGDMVLVARGDDGAFILSVLTRDANTPADLRVPEANRVHLRANSELEVSAPTVKFTARNLNLISETLTQTGRQLVRNFSKSLETVVDKIVSARTITTTTDTRSTAVKEVDSLQAGILVENIDSVATQNSEISLVTASEDVRLDAKRVSVG